MRNTNAKRTQILLARTFMFALMTFLGCAENNWKNISNGVAANAEMTQKQETKMKEEKVLSLMSAVNSNTTAKVKELLIKGRIS